MPTATRWRGPWASRRRIITGRPPAVTAASVNGTALTLTFDRALDPGSRPAGWVFNLVATEGRQGRVIAGTGTVAIAGATVTVTLSSAVTARDSRLNFSFSNILGKGSANPKQIDNPLRDTDGILVANIRGRAVTNATPHPPGAGTALVDSRHRLHAGHLSGRPERHRHPRPGARPDYRDLDARHHRRRRAIGGTVKNSGRIIVRNFRATNFSRLPRPGRTRSRTWM